ncbi:MAG: oxidoreductase [Glaciihabitans sp.]|nr:oxidoreductase [Glaciihabitans sp.]
MSEFPTHAATPITSPEAVRGTLGILGAGRVGTSVARAALKAGYAVNIAASGDPSQIALIVEIVVPGAKAVTAAEAVASADIVVLALPLHKYRSIDAAALSGKIVIDAMNYWSPIDGTQDDFEEGTSSETIAEYLPGARLVKTLNHIGYHELEADDKPSGHPHRRALAVASDDTQAAYAVMHFIENLGYDAVNTGSLASGASFEPGTIIFGAAHTAAEIHQELARWNAAVA